MNDNLKFVAALRHGDYDRSLGERGPLNQTGRRQMEHAAIKLKSIFGPNLTVSIVTSPLPRGGESGEIIGKEFRTGVQGCGYLRDGSRQSGQEAAEPLLEEFANGADALVLIAHNEAPGGIISGFISKFGLKVEFKASSPKEGDGFLLNLKTGEVRESLFARTK